MVLLLYRPWLTMVSFITDADYSTCAVPMATAEPWASLANVNIVHSPAMPLSCSLLLNPAELGSSKTSVNFQMLKKKRCNAHSTVNLLITPSSFLTLRRHGLAAGLWPWSMSSCWLDCRLWIRGTGRGSSPRCLQTREDTLTGPAAMSQTWKWRG